VVRLLEDVDRLKERASDLRRHFDMANTDLEKLTTSADRINKRGNRIGSLDVEPETNGALPGEQRPRLVQ
jgi:DNA recombination protein RmuC